MTLIASRRGLIGMALLASFALTGPAQAAPVSFSVALSGDQQVPPVTTAGSGKADLTYDAATKTVTWSISFQGLSSPATMAHSHGPAAAGANASVIIWLSKKGEAPDSPFKGEATLTPEQANEFAAGQWYINVHSKDHPAGEIRGQAVLPKGT